MNPEFRYRPLLQQLVEKVENLNKKLRALEANRPLYDVASEESPDQFTSTPQNDLDSLDADVLRLTANQAVTITGIAYGQRGRFLELYNASAFTITLAHETATSTEANRFSCPGGTNVTITSGQRQRLYYDSTLGRWTTG